MVFCALSTWDTYTGPAGGGGGWGSKRASGKQGNFCHPPCSDTAPLPVCHHFPRAVFRMALAVLGARCLASAWASLTGAEQCGVGSLVSRFRAEAAVRAQHRLPASR